MSGLRYKDAGVDIDAGAELVERLRARKQLGKSPKILGGIGGFASLVEVPREYDEPVLVAGTDGVGTKLKLAFKSGRHETVGIDLVAMCVNDIITCGAKPLFFLDYFATSALEVAQAESVITGILEGCSRARCALVGGETAELPGFFAKGEYDIAGFALGVVDRSQIVDGHKVKVGDAIIGIASSGLHSNGFSLANRALFDHAKLPFDHDVQGRQLIDTLLEPTTIYEPLVRPLFEECILSASAHITGGGIVENLPRILTTEHAAVVRRNAWDVPPVFELVQRTGSVADDEMARVFNLGIGFILVCSQKDCTKVLDHCERAGYRAWNVGEITSRTSEPFQWA